MLGSSFAWKLLTGLKTGSLKMVFILNTDIPLSNVNVSYLKSARERFK